MQTKHYIVKNVSDFSNQADAVKRLEKYLNCIEEKAFPAIEEVFGSAWSGGKIYIKLDNSTRGATYGPNGVKMGIKNGNIQKEYPENLWGCLFHETHHAFLSLIIRDKRDGKILNGGHKAEVFNYTFMAITYMKLKEKNELDEQMFDKFFSKLEHELGSLNRNYRDSNKYEYENNLPNNTMDLFQEYVGMFSVKNENFTKFIYYIKKSNSVFTDIRDFRQDLDKIRKYLD